VDVQEEDDALPRATIRICGEIAELGIVRWAGDDFHVVFQPPESHVGQDLTTVEACDESCAVDVSNCTLEDVHRIFAGM
jgi:hypothetical protein